MSDYLDRLAEEATEAKRRSREAHQRWLDLRRELQRVEHLKGERPELAARVPELKRQVQEALEASKVFRNDARLLKRDLLNRL